MKNTKDYSTWCTADGKSILVKDMNTSHLLNSIKKIKSSNWRIDWLPYLEEELARRNMYVASPDKDKRLISEDEMCYFLETSCDGQVIYGENELCPKYTNPNKAVEEYLKHKFVIPKENDKSEFIDKLFYDVGHIAATEFYRKYDMYKIENAFEIEWKNFIDLMLGRKETNEEK